MRQFDNLVFKLSEPIITVNGGPELHIKHGSRINISCEIENYPNEISYVVWYKDDKVNREM